MFAVSNPFKFFTDLFTQRAPDLYSHRSEPEVSNEVILSDDDIKDVQVDYMSKVDLIKLVRPMPGAYVTDDEVLERIERIKNMVPVPQAPRSLVVDKMSHMPQPTKCLRSRVVALLRLLEDDIRCIENTRGLEMYNAKNPLNELVMRDHKALYKTLKEIKAKGGQVLKEFHEAIDNLGYWGGYRKDERVIRIHHPNLPYGYIEV